MKIHDQLINKPEISTVSKESKLSLRKMSVSSEDKQMNASSNNDVINVKIDIDNRGMKIESPASQESRSPLRKMSASSDEKQNRPSANNDVINVKINSLGKNTFMSNAENSTSIHNLRSVLKKFSSSSEGKQINISNNSDNNDVLNVIINTSDNMFNSKSAAEKSKQSLESTFQNVATEGKSAIRQEASASAAQCERKMSSVSETNESLSASKKRMPEDKSTIFKVLTKTENDSRIFNNLEPDQTIVFPGRWNMPGFNTILKDLNLFQNSQDNMVIRVQDDDSKLEITLDTSKYKPEELSVSVESGAVTVEGKHEEKSEDGCKMASRQFQRRYTLQRGSTTSDVTSNLSKDGVLVITALKKEHTDINVEIKKK